MSMLSDVIRERFYALAEKYSYRRQDFRLEPGRIEDQDHAVTVETATATFIPTGKVRPYKIHRDSSWSFLFETDLQRGAFL